MGLKAKLFLRSHPRDRRGTGFTLIELLLVVSIVSILGSLAIPYFTLVQSKSRRSEMTLNLAGIYTAESAYFSTDNSWNLPSCANCICSSGTPDTWSKSFEVAGFGLSGGTSKYYGICVEPDLPGPGDLTVQGAGNIDRDAILDWGRVTLGDKEVILIQDDVLES